MSTQPLLGGQQVNTAGPAWTGRRTSLLPSRFPSDGHTSEDSIIKRATGVRRSKPWREPLGPATSRPPTPPPSPRTHDALLMGLVEGSNSLQEVTAHIRYTLNRRDSITGASRPAGPMKGCPSQQGARGPRGKGGKAIPSALEEIIPCMVDRMRQTSFLHINKCDSASDLGEFCGLICSSEIQDPGFWTAIANKVAELWDRNAYQQHEQQLEQGGTSHEHYTPFRHLHSPQRTTGHDDRAAPSETQVSGPVFYLNDVIICEMSSNVTKFYYPVSFNLCVSSYLRGFIVSDSVFISNILSTPPHAEFSHGTFKQDSRPSVAPVVRGPGSRGHGQAPDPPPR